MKKMMKISSMATMIRHRRTNDLLNRGKSDRSNQPLTIASNVRTNHQAIGELGIMWIYASSHTAVDTRSMPTGFEIAQPLSASTGNARATTGIAASPISSTVSSVAIACSIYL